MNQILNKIVQQVEGAQRFLVCSHESPDGDAIGSTLGLTLGLQRLGKDAVAYNVDGVPEILKFLPGSESLVTELRADAAFDVVFVLDAGNLGRAACPLAENSPMLINLDHHPGSDFGHLCYLDTRAAATAVLVYRLLCGCGLSLDLDVAAPLYAGILSDTGSFRYANSNPEAFRVAADLVALGIDTWTIASALYESQPLQRMKLLAQVLPTLHVAASGKYASVSMTLEMLEKTGALPEHTDGFVNYPRAIAGVEVAVFFRQVDLSTIKVGFRSRGSIDVGRLSVQLGGGGHKNAAGAFVEGRLDQVSSRVFHLLETLLN